MNENLWRWSYASGEVCFGVSLAVHRVSRSDYSDNVLFDQVDGCAAFSVVPNPARPIHYKFHVPVKIEVEASHG